MPFSENLLATFIALFEYIPTEEEYAQFSATSENSLILQASQILYESPTYQNSILSLDSLENGDKALIILEKLLPSLSEDSSLYTSAIAYLETILGQKSLTESLYMAASAVLNSDLDILAEYKKILVNKVAFSEYVMNESGTLVLTQEEITEILSHMDSGETSLEEATQYVDQATQSWHFMVYMMADNNLEVYALLDLQELSALASLEQASVSVALDRSDSYSTALGNWTDTRYGAVEENQTIEEIANSLESAGEINMGSSESLTAFINWSISQNPADNYALILWDHGLGYEGIGIDEGNNGDSLTLAEIQQAISGSNLEQVDQIIFDACSMAMIEVASALSSVTDIIVASQDIVPSEGISYSKLAELISSQNGIGGSEELGQLFTQSYSEYFSDLSSMALSVLDTTDASTFVAAANDFATTVLSSSDDDLLKIEQARTEAKYYYDNKSVDLDSFLSALIELSPSDGLATASTELLNASHEIVIDNVASKEQSEGLSIYWPSTDLGQYYQSQYIEVAEELDLASWGTLIETYWDYIA